MASDRGTDGGTDHNPDIELLGSEETQPRKGSGKGAGKASGNAADAGNASGAGKGAGKAGNAAGDAAPPSDCRMYSPFPPDYVFPGEIYPDGYLGDIQIAEDLRAQRDQMKSLPFLDDANAKELQCLEQLLESIEFRIHAFQDRGLHLNLDHRQPGDKRKR